MNMIKRYLSIILIFSFIICICPILPTAVYANEAYVSVMEQEDDALSFIDKDSVFMIHTDFYHTNGEKKKYSDFGAGAYVSSDGILMLPADLVSEGFDITVTIDEMNILTSNGASASLGSIYSSNGELESEPLVLNNILYVPAVSFTEKVLEKHVYEDERGFILTSENQITYQNTENNTDAIDVIYRYMQFDNPTGDEIHRAIRQNATQRPAFLIKNDEITVLRNKINSDAEFYAAAQKLLFSADKLLDAPTIEWEIYDGLRLLDRCHNVCDIIETMAVAYLITGRDDYLDRMWLETKNTLNWPDWNLPGAASGGDGHALDAGTLGKDMAIAYDFLHDYISSDDLMFFKDELQNKCLDYFVESFQGKASFKGTDGRLVRSNWGAVIGGGLFTLSLSVLASEDEGTSLAQKCKFIAENSLKVLQYSIGNFCPGGAVSEKVGYYNFYLTGLGLSINAMNNICNTDYGFLDTLGWSDAANFITYIQSLNGIYNYSSDTNGDKNTAWYDMTYLLASLYDNSQQMVLLNSFRKSLGLSMGAFGLLWNKPEYNIEQKISMPLDKYYSKRYQIMKSGWNSKEDVYVAIRDGYNSLGDHCDKGSFIFESDGVRWFSDIGGENIYVTGGYYSEAGYTLYAKRAEGHNAMVINPEEIDYPDQIVYSTSIKTGGESNDCGATAIFDLSDTYGKEKVKWYNRGFFLTDDRSSLIVQDELEFTEHNSKFYHFMHVTDDGVITINSDGKSATVEKENEILDVTVICDADEWKLEKWKAENIFPSMKRDTGDPATSEYDRSHISKLAIVGTDSGKLNISVKMSVRGKGREYSAHTFIPMNEWILPEGERTYESKFLNIEDNMLIGREDIVIQAEIGKSFDSAELLVDSDSCSAISSGNPGMYSFSVSRDSFVGKNLVQVSLNLKKSGNSEIVCKALLKLADLSNANDFYKTIDFQNCSTGEILPEDLYNNYGGLNTLEGGAAKYEIVSDEGNLKYKVSLEPQTKDYNHSEKSLKPVISDGIVEIGFRMKVSSIYARVQFLPKGDSPITFNTTGENSLQIFTPGGKFANTSKYYFPNREYSIKIILDFTNGKYKLCVDNECISNGTFTCGNGINFRKFRLTYRATSGVPCDFTIDDINASYKMYAETGGFYKNLSVTKSDDNKIHAALDAMVFNSTKKVYLIVGTYKGEDSAELVNVIMEPVTINSSLKNTSVSLDIGDAEYAKIMLWDSLDIKPLINNETLINLNNVN